MVEVILLKYIAIYMHDVTHLDKAVDLPHYKHNIHKASPYFRVESIFPDQCIVTPNELTFINFR